MADVYLEKNGKRFKTSDPAKVSAAKAKGFVVVSGPKPSTPTAHADAAGHPETGEPAAEQSQDEGLPGIATAPLKAAKWMAAYRKALVALDKRVVAPVPQPKMPVSQIHVTKTAAQCLRAVAAAKLMGGAGLYGLIHGAATSTDKLDTDSIGALGA